MLNGVAVPAAGAVGDGPDAAMSAHHAGHGAMPEQTPPDDQTETPMGECCQAGDCDCGCTAPQVTTLRLAAAPRVTAGSPALPTPARAPRVSGTPSTPFRPPA